MSNHFIRFSGFRRLWKPAAVTGAGGTAGALWFEEILLVGQDLLALIFLPIIAGAIYLLNLFIFNSCMPKPEDLNNANDKGATK